MGGHSYGYSMGISDYNDGVNRTVWESSNDTRLLTVTGLLKPGEYLINKSVNEDGNIILELELKE